MIALAAFAVVVVGTLAWALSRETARRAGESPVAQTSGTGTCACRRDAATDGPFSAAFMNPWCFAVSLTAALVAVVGLPLIFPGEQTQAQMFGFGLVTHITVHLIVALLGANRVGPARTAAD